jgi:protein-disulfide isomerase
LIILTFRGIAAAAALGYAAVSLGAGTSASQNAADNTRTAGDNHAIVAMIGNERLTEADVIRQDREAFDKLQADYDLKLRQLQLKQAQARYDLLKQDADKLLDKRALEAEAKAHGMTPKDVLAEIKVAAVTDDEVTAFYEANKARATQPFEQLKPQITQYLANQHNTDATRTFYDGLRAKHGMAWRLEPYRMPVAATGPAQGKPEAPVTIVEFADFQCPYCRSSADVLKAVLKKHPDDVRLVFRNLPLQNVHPNAATAAAAAVCADRQHMFWAMHDAMYDDQKALSEPALRSTAERLGLNGAEFASCIASPDAKAAVDADAKAADDLAIGGTPYFFINGRPLNGTVPEEQFEAIISEELRRASSGKHG